MRIYIIVLLLFLHACQSSPKNTLIKPIAPCYTYVYDGTGSRPPFNEYIGSPAIQENTIQNSLIVELFTGMHPTESDFLGKQDDNFRDYDERAYRVYDRAILDFIWTKDSNKLWILDTCHLRESCNNLIIIGEVGTFQLLHEGACVSGIVNLEIGFRTFNHEVNNTDLKPYISEFKFLQNLQFPQFNPPFRTTNCKLSYAYACQKEVLDEYAFFHNKGRYGGIPSASGFFDFKQYLLSQRNSLARKEAVKSLIEVTASDLRVGIWDHVY